jgi:hypothetical protein
VLFLNDARQPVQSLRLMRTHIKRQLCFLIFQCFIAFATVTRTIIAFFAIAIIVIVIVIVIAMAIAFAIAIAISNTCPSALSKDLLVTCCFCCYGCTIT